MSTTDRIAFLAFGQALGTTNRYMCPRCLGGSKEEESLAITISDIGGIYWICHRSSCGFRGSPRNSRGSPPVGGLKPSEPRVYTRPTKALSPDQQEIIRAKYGSYFLDIRYNKETDRFVLPVNGPRFGQHRGCLARSLSGDTPKSLTYKESEPFIHWAYPRESARRFITIIVEDWFSSEKCAKAGFTGVSLNGTHINQFMVDEIKEQRDLGLVILALDQDAYPKALKLQAEYREQFPNGLKVVKLERDLKYESEMRINEIADEVLGAGNNHSECCVEGQGVV